MREIFLPAVTHLAAHAHARRRNVPGPRDGIDTDTVAATMNTSQPVSSHIEGVGFGFLSEADVRALSVKRITNSITFDSLLHPVPGGLHDAALGAFLDNS